MNSRRDKPGDVRDVREQIRADFARDFAHAFEVNDTRIGTRAHGDHFWFMLARHLCELVVINLFAVLADAVVDNFEKFAGKIRLVAMRQVPAVRQIHRQHFVAGLQHGKINGHVRAAAGVRLDVHVFRAKKFFRAVNRKLLDRVNVFAAAIPAFFRITLGVFVRQHRALRLQNRGADKIFDCDQLDVFLLAQFFEVNGLGNLRVNISQAQLERREAEIQFLTRRSWRPPSNFAARKASRIFFASSGAVFPP